MTGKFKTFLVRMYYPMTLSSAVISEEGISELDVEEKLKLKYPNWVIEEIKEVK